MSKPPIGSRVRVDPIMGSVSGSIAMPAVISRMDESGSGSYRKGISVSWKSGMSLTSTAMRPVSGILGAIPSEESSVPSGSTSITISNPG